MALGMLSRRYFKRMIDRTGSLIEYAVSVQAVGLLDMSPNQGIHNTAGDHIFFWGPRSHQCGP